MISARELRIGNWVNSSGTDVQIRTYDIFLVEDGLVVEPIPLTVAWLYKFEFGEKIGTHYQREVPGRFCKMIKRQRNNLHVHVYRAHDLWWVSTFESSTESPASTEVKYVHQLQNLYFALTGEEL